MQSEFKPGDPVIYRVSKTTTHPGPRAKSVAPAAKGETYNYAIDKFWMVGEILGNGKLRLVTRRGKERLIEKNDPQLRAPRWWERFLYRDRFPRKETAPQTQQTVS